MVQYILLLMGIIIIITALNSKKPEIKDKKISDAKVSSSNDNFEDRFEYNLINDRIDAINDRIDAIDDRIDDFVSLLEQMKDYLNRSKKEEIKTINYEKSQISNIAKQSISKDTNDKNKIIYYMHKNNMNIEDIASNLNITKGEVLLRLGIGSKR